MKISSTKVGQDRGPVGPYVIPFRLISATSQTRQAFGVFTPRQPFMVTGVDVHATAVTAVLTFDGYLAGPDETIFAGVLGIDATPEKFLTAAATVRIGGRIVQKTAATAIVFTAAHVVTASKFGCIRVQIDNAGTVSTKVVGSPQAYASAALALAALPAADTAKRNFGYIAIAAKAATWTANTDDLTDGSDLTTATFVSEVATVASLFTGVITPVANEVVAGVMAAALSTRQDKTGTKDVVMAYTSDGNGAAPNGAAYVRIAVYPGHGDGG
jgi:hypothetical protein